MRNEIAKEYKIRVDEICKNWKNNDKVKNLIRCWYFKLLSVYDRNNNFIDKKSLEEYVDIYLTALEKLNIINIYSLEEIIKSPDSDFYPYIIKIPDNVEIVPEKRIMKENDKYSLNKNGEYCLLNVGLCNANQLWINVIEDEAIIKTFHHELTHIIQDNTKYKYPTFFPFSIAMKTIIREGDAQYNERIIAGKMHFNYNEWDFNRIHRKTSVSDVYYPLYIMLMLSLPKKFRENWYDGKFDITILFNELYQNYIDLFAIMSILMADILIPDIRNTYIDEIKFYQKEYKARKLEIAQNYTKRCQELEKRQAELMNGLEKIGKNIILQEEYKKYFQEELLEIKQDKALQYYQKNQEILQLEFGENLIKTVKYYIEENCSIFELFQMFKNKVYDLLLEKESTNSTDLIEDIFFNERKTKK